MLTCVDGVSLRQNSRQDSPWGGKSPFGQRLGENHRNPLLPELGIPALFAARPPPVFHRKERLVSCAPAESGKPDPPGYRLVSRLWQMDTACLPALWERALSAPQRETEGSLTIPARIGTPFQPVKGNREPEMTRRCSEHSSRLSPGAVDHICVKPAGTRGHLLHHNIARSKTRRRVLSDFALPRHLKRQLQIRRTNPTTTFEALASNSLVDKSARIYLPVSGFSLPLSVLLEPVEELPSSLSSVVVLVSSLVSDTA